MACPYCESEIGHQMSAGIFNEHFWTNMADLLLPISILLIIVALIHFGVPWMARLLPPSPRHCNDDMAFSSPPAAGKWVMTSTSGR